MVLELRSFLRKFLVSVFLQDIGFLSKDLKNEIFFLANVFFSNAALVRVALNNCICCQKKSLHILEIYSFIRDFHSLFHCFIEACLNWKCFECIHCSTEKFSKANQNSRGIFSESFSDNEPLLCKRRD